MTSPKTSANEYLAERMDPVRKRNDVWWPCHRWLCERGNHHADSPFGEECPNCGNAKIAPVDFASAEHFWVLWECFAPQSLTPAHEGIITVWDRAREAFGNIGTAVVPSAADFRKEFVPMIAKATGWEGA